MTLAQAQFTVNGGAPVIGTTQIVAGGAVIQWSGVDTAPWEQARWELFGFPKGWAAPAGWTYDAASETVYSTDLTPQPITLPATNVMWGTWTMRLIVNNGVDPSTGATGIVVDDAGQPLPSGALDIKTGVATLSPVLGMREIALFEGAQFGGVRSWVDALQTMQHLIETFAAGTAGAWQDGTDAAYTIVGTLGQQSVTIPALTASHTWKFPANPTDGMRVKLCDLVGHYLTAGGSALALTMQGNAGTEHIFAEGADKGTTYAVPHPLLDNGSVEFEYRASNTSWNMV